MTRNRDAGELGTTLEAGCFCADLSRVTHAIAQPLTVLRTRFDSGLVSRMSLSDFRVLAGDTAKDIERLCELFASLQEFIAIEDLPATVAVGNVAHLVAVVVDEMDVLFEKAGVGLRVDVSREDVSAMLHMSRTYEVVHSVLRLGQRVSGRGDRVNVTVLRCSGGVQIGVRSSARSVAIDAGGELSLALAAAKMRSQQGSMTWTSEPFGVELRWPGVAAR